MIRDYRGARRNRLRDIRRRARKAGAKLGPWAGAWPRFNVGEPETKRILKGKPIFDDKGKVLRFGPFLPKPLKTGKRYSYKDKR